jgi:DNA-binding NarL/FixJ family response regulator
MDKRRVLLLWVQPLLGEGLEHILRGLEDVELIGPWDLDSGALSRLSEEAPDIVIVADGEREKGESVASLTAQILERYPDLPIVRIGLEQNALRIYTSRTLPARSADLIEAIRGLPLHPHQGEAGSQP